MLAVYGLPIADTATLLSKLHNFKIESSTASPHAAGCADLPSEPIDIFCPLISIQRFGISLDKNIEPSGRICIIDSPLPITHPEPSEKYIVHQSPLTSLLHNISTLFRLMVCLCYLNIIFSKPIQLSWII